MPAKTATISRVGHIVGATGPIEALRYLSQSFVKTLVVAPFPDVTDNSTGTPSTGVGAALTLPGPVADVSVSGTNEATVADVNAGLSAVRNAIRTLYTKTNAVASACGFAPITYSGGGTDGAGTVAAIPKTVAGSATGPDDAASNALIASYNSALYNLGALLNRIAEATGDDNIRLNPTNQTVVNAQAVPVLGVDVGAAQGVAAVSAAAWVTVLTAYADAVATLSAHFNRVTSPGTVRLIAVR